MPAASDHETVNKVVAEFDEWLASLQPECTDLVCAVRTKHGVDEVSVGDFFLWPALLTEPISVDLLKKRFRQEIRALVPYLTHGDPAPESATVYHVVRNYYDEGYVEAVVGVYADKAEADKHLAGCPADEDHVVRAVPVLPTYTSPREHL